MSETAFWQLTNEQRRCFGIAPVDAEWELRCLPRSRYHDFDVYFCQDGRRIRYVILHGEGRHQEYAADERLSADGMFIEPKRSSSPIRLTAATLIKRSPVGMHLWWNGEGPGAGAAGLENASSRQTYYRSETAGQPIGTLAAFREWIASWCEKTTEADLADVAAFAARTMQTVKHREGDYFRFRWYRRLWGYGRILLSYDRLRREKKPFYDCLMGKPVVVELFKIVATDRVLTVAEVEKAPVLPAFNMMDDALHYGEFEIIGHGGLPEDADERCPVMYGEGPAYDGVLRYQQGSVYRELRGVRALGERKYINNSVGWYPHVTLPEMVRYILQPGCGDYWTDAPWQWQKEEDLRNPANARILQAVRRQMRL